MVDKGYFLIIFKVLLFVSCMEYGIYIIKEFNLIKNMRISFIKDYDFY